MPLRWPGLSGRKIRAPAAALLFAIQSDGLPRITAQAELRVFHLIDLPEIQDLTQGFPFNLLGAGAIIVSLVVFWLALIWGSGIERILVIAAIIGLWSYWGLQNYGLI
jgi:hypothetical protein